MLYIIGVAIYAIILVFLVRFFKFIHECDEEMQNQIKNK